MSKVSLYTIYTIYIPNVGVVVSIRKREDRVAVWTRNAANEELQVISAKNTLERQDMTLHTTPLLKFLLKTNATRPPAHKPTTSW